MLRERVLRFVSPETLFFAALFSAQFLGRTILDWFMPTGDFHTRAAVSTILGVGTLLAAGFYGSWRSGSFRAGAVSGLATACMAAIFSLAVVAILLVVWHGPQTMRSIRSSGGLEEVFGFPLMLILPGVVLGFVGGVASMAVKKAFAS